MNFDGRMRDLGPVRFRPLLRATRSLDEAAWNADTFRQEMFRVHAQTRSVRLVWTYHEDWPETRTETLEPWAEFEPLLTPILTAAAVRLGHATTLASAMLARLDPGQSIKRHLDAAPFFAHCHRMHVPLMTHPGVRFVVDGQSVPLEVGRLYELNNRRLHEVSNVGPSPRIHLIFDLAPT